MTLIVAIALAIFVLPSPWGIVAIVLGIAIEVGELVFWFRHQRRQKVLTGVEAHVGEKAEVVRVCAPEGRVRFRGDLWKARSREPLAIGEIVRVADTEGLTLLVEREPPASGSVHEVDAR